MRVMLKEAATSDQDPMSLIISFQDLPDPRVEGRCDHKLIDIIVMTVCAVIAGAESWVDVADFGEQSVELFSPYGSSIYNGIYYHGVKR